MEEKQTELVELFAARIKEMYGEKDEFNVPCQVLMELIAPNGPESDDNTIRTFRMKHLPLPIRRLLVTVIKSYKEVSEILKSEGFLIVGIEHNFEKITQPSRERMRDICENLLNVIIRYEHLLGLSSPLKFYPSSATEGSGKISKERFFNQIIELLMSISPANLRYDSSDLMKLRNLINRSLHIIKDIIPLYRSAEKQFKKFLEHSEIECRLDIISLALALMFLTRKLSGYKLLTEEAGADRIGEYDRRLKEALERIAINKNAKRIKLLEHLKNMKESSAVELISLTHTGSWVCLPEIEEPILINCKRAFVEWHSA